MNRLLLVPFLCLLAAPLRADEPTRALQSELKAQGFYYGEIDGASGPALGAAIKRYQIRNGLEVTGTATPETMQSLNLGNSPKPANAPVPGLAPAPERSPAEPIPPSERQPDAEPATPRPRVDLRKKESVVESDQRALREEQPQSVRRTPHDPSVVAPPADLYRSAPTSVPRYGDLFAGSPFASAPPPLQDQTLRAAQRQLASQGFYAGVVDGQPGPATTDAIVMYQRARNLPHTGRLDFETLNEMRLMPGPSTANPALKPFNAPQGRRVYRGVWVD